MAWLTALFMLPVKLVTAAINWFLSLSLPARIAWSVGVVQFLLCLLTLLLVIVSGGRPTFQAWWTPGKGMQLLILLLLVPVFVYFAMRLWLHEEVSRWRDIEKAWREARIELDRQQIVVPVGEFGCLVVSDPVCLDLLGREIFGNVDGELIEPKLLSSFEASVPADNYPFGVDNDRLANTKLTDRCSNGIDSVIVDAGIVRVGTNAIERPKFDFHEHAFPGEKRNGKGSVDVCLFGCLAWFCWIARWVDCLGFKIPTHKTNSL